MASLKFREKNILEEFLEMGGGYVLNFNDRTFAEFFRDFDIEIDSAPYIEGHSGSKANRMRSFWERAPDQLVGEVLRELIEYTESYRPSHSSTDGCRNIATRLLSENPQPAKPQPSSAHAHQGGAQERIMDRPIEIFFSYAHEDVALVEEVRPIELNPNQGVTISKGVPHRPRAPKRTVMLMVETDTINPIGNDEL